MPSFSTAVLTIEGSGGTVITNGIATDELNQQWLLPATVTIPGGGSIDVTATAQFVGFVTAQAATITNIFTPTRGWQTVNNVDAATPGEPVETDAQLRQRQSLSTAISSKTPFDATLAAVANVTGVTKVGGYENYTNSTDANGIVAHATCVVVVGGGSTDIANAIVSKKTPGTNPVGNTGPITVSDDRGMPVIIYFSRAITAEIHCTVNLVAGTGWSSNYEDEIKTAVAAAINALGIGSIVFYTALFVPALLVGTPAYGTFSVTSITIGKNGGGQSAANINLAVGINAENPVCDPTSDITINVS